MARLFFLPHRIWWYLFWIFARNCSPVFALKHFVYLGIEGWLHMTSTLIPILLFSPAFHSWPFLTPLFPSLCPFIPTSSSPFFSPLSPLDFKGKGSPFPSGLCVLSWILLRLNTSFSRGVLKFLWPGSSLSWELRAAENPWALLRCHEYLGKQGGCGGYERGTKQPWLGCLPTTVRCVAMSTLCSLSLSLCLPTNKMEMITVFTS